MKNKAKLLKYLIAIVVAAFFIWLTALAGFLFLPTNARDNQDPVKQKEMMVLVLEWGRLAPFPANAANVTVETEGSLFTRDFRASFIAPKQDIQNWIKNSPGFIAVIPEKITDSKVRYHIVPGSGANKAEVTIDSILNKVEIYVSWN
jgi:hypothetical protein